jgi:lipoyl(octanoyl) transferase
MQPPPMSATGDSLFRFPCSFPLKIIGLANDALAPGVVDVVLRHAPDFDAATMARSRIERRPVPESQLHHHGPQPGAARRALPRTEHSSTGQDGPVKIGELEHPRLARVTARRRGRPPLRGAPPLLVRHLGRTDYRQTWQAMVDFSAARSAETPDELWCCEHSPVLTLGQAGKPEHLLADLGIPLVTDRPGRADHLSWSRSGGDLPAARPLAAPAESARAGLGHRAGGDRPARRAGRAAERHGGAPGVYVGAAKVAALGLRVRKSCCYHGVSLNVDMDLSPFAAINPCGYPGLPVTQTRDLGISLTPAQAATALVRPSRRTTGAQAMSSQERGSLRTSRHGRPGESPGSRKRAS